MSLYGKFLQTTLYSALAMAPATVFAAPPGKGTYQSEPRPLESLDDSQESEEIESQLPGIEDMTEEELRNRPQPYVIDFSPRRKDSTPPVATVTDTIEESVLEEPKTGSLQPTEEKAGIATVKINDDKTEFHTESSLELFPHPKKAKKFVMSRTAQPQFGRNFITFSVAEQTIAKRGEPFSRNQPSFHAWGEGDIPIWKALALHPRGMFYTSSYSSHYKKWAGLDFVNVDLDTSLELRTTMFRHKDSGLELWLGGGPHYIWTSEFQHNGNLRTDVSTHLAGFQFSGGINYKYLDFNVSGSYLGGRKYSSFEDNRNDRMWSVQSCLTARVSWVELASCTRFRNERVVEFPGDRTNLNLYPGAQLRLNLPYYVSTHVGVYSRVALDGESQDSRFHIGAGIGWYF